MEHGVREPQAKRRKVRKGTRSCWECKGRKVRCTYMTDNDTVCEGCFRRGTDCISQELPEQPLAPVERRRQMGNRMIRVEKLIEKLVKGPEKGPTAPGSSISESSEGASSDVQVHVSSSIRAAPARDTAQYTDHEADSLVLNGSTHDSFTGPDTRMLVRPEASYSAKLKNLSEALLAVFPLQENVDLIVKMAGPLPSFFHQLVRTPFKDFRMGEAEEREHLAELTIRHTPQTHPLIIARQMLLLAISFRYIHPDFHQNLEGFSEPPGTVMKRVAHAAIDLISTEDRMIDSVDGLECLLLTCTFQADSGNLRSSWSTIRRAIFKAQLMCLHRQQRPPLRTVQPGNKWDPQYLWFRIVYYDRFYSLILGLPQGSTDVSMGTFEDDTPMGRLERRHCSLAGRILRRNERDHGGDDIIDAEAIDAELRKLSESMPSKWWLLPNLASIQDSEQLFWETIKLAGQLFHYILLSHLHLPFMLRSSSGPDQHRFEYSRMACVNASRDLLYRYRAFRSFRSGSYCCHSMDFFAITASMTLVLAHLDAHRSRRDLDKVLVHQRISDRAMMEEILDNMEQVGTLNKAKTMSEKGAGVLRRLLAIEAEAAVSSSYRIAAGDFHSNDNRVLRLSIPYLGVITIAQDGHISPAADEPSDLGPRNEAASSEDRQPVISSPVALPLEKSRNEIQGQQQAISLLSREGRVQQPATTMSETLTAENESFIVGNFAGAQSLGPGLATGDEDWTLHGVDLGFFDSMMRDSDAQADDIGEFWWLTEDFPSIL
ncbi:hypothetical protein AB5N19_07747 [Seiridium cardinale]